MTRGLGRPAVEQFLVRQCRPVVGSSDEQRAYWQEETETISRMEFGPQR